MAYRCRFVDTIAASPTVRLDLNDGVTFRLLLAGTNLSPPAYRRSKTGTMLSEGDEVGALTPANRNMTVRLLVSAASRDLLSTALATLHTELSRWRNILELRLGSTSRFLRTYASPDYEAVNDEGALNRVTIDLHLECEPYCYGLKVTQAGLAVANDPAAGTRPQFLDVNGVTGELPTPAVVTITAVSDTSFAIGSRRHGTPSAAMPWVIQAETFTAIDLSATGGPDAAMSGGTPDYMRTTLATSPLAMHLVTGKNITGLTVDHRGLYRCFVRYRRSSAVPKLQVQLQYAGVNTDPQIYKNPAITTAYDTQTQMIDVGLLQIPVANDPQYDAIGTELGVGDFWVGLAISRGTDAAGTMTFDWDYLVLVPADEELTLVNAPSTLTGADIILDAVTGQPYYLASGKVASRQLIEVIGAVAPMLQPGSNRWTIVRDIRGTSTQANLITDSTTVAVDYLPRYVYP